MTKKTTHNDITGDKIKTKPNSNAYRDGWDKAFKKPPSTEEFPCLVCSSYHNGLACPKMTIK